LAFFGGRKRLFCKGNFPVEEMPSRERASSTADKVRESIDKLRTLPLEEVDKDLYELALKGDAEAAALVKKNLEIAANLTSADEAAIMATIRQVDSEIENEERSKSARRSFVAIAIIGIAIAVSYRSLSLDHRNEVQLYGTKVLQSLMSWVKSLYRS